MTDAAKLPMMLTELRMPTIGRLWQDIGATADREGWGAARFLAALCEHEIAERSQRRIGRHLAESGLQPGKTLATFDFTAAPSVRKPHIEALASGATWIEAGSNILIFGPSGTGGLAARQSGCALRTVEHQAGHRHGRRTEASTARMNL